MKFKVTRTSYYNSDKFEILDFYTLEEFLTWVSQQGDVIVSTSGSEDDTVNLEIYDDYRE